MMGTGRRAVRVRGAQNHKKGRMAGIMRCLCLSSHGRGAHVTCHVCARVCVGACVRACLVRVCVRACMTS